MIHSKNESGNIAIKDTKIAIVTSVPFFLVTNLKQQIKYLHSAGMDITLISSEGAQLSQLKFGDRLNHIVVGIEREPAPIRDIIALFRLILIFRKHRFKIVHTTTPKAGLLAVIAGIIAGIKIRLHTFTGQRWVTMRGMSKKIVKNSDRIIGILNTRCYADSKSQMEFLVSEKVISSNKISVLGEGSLAGVDTEHFRRDCIGSNQKELLRSSLGLETNSVVLIFIGRVTRDKGIVELMEAFGALRDRGLAVELLLIGPVEARGDAAIQKAIEPRAGLHTLGYRDDPESYMAISDILCLPSYREGFGTVVIEAAAMGIPTLGTRIPGLVDAVVDGVTGLLVPRANSRELEKGLSKLIQDQALRSRLGEAARLRCLQEYDANIVNTLLVGEYTGFMEKI